MYKIYNGSFADMLFSENSIVIENNKRAKAKQQELDIAEKNLQLIKEIISIKESADALNDIINDYESVILSHDNGAKLLASFRELYDAIGEYSIEDMHTNYETEYNTIDGELDDINDVINTHKGNIENLVNNTPINNVYSNDLSSIESLSIKLLDIANRLGAIIEESDYSRKYLTTVALEDGTFTFSANGVSYSLDNGETWIELPANTASPTVTAGNKIMWKGELTPSSSNGIGTFSATGNFDVQGNVMSLLYGDNYKGQTNLTGKDYAFYKLFNNNTKVVNAENLSLPATTLASYSYKFMFRGCTSLVTAPELPATTLANNCYDFMFSGCTSLVNVPELPATTLAQSCYNTMFSGCTSLTTAPELPATTLAGSCYSNMFNGCTSLTTASELPATTLANYCYNYMFYGCTSLVTAPELPATTLAGSCYGDMFHGCTSLVTAPELPATTLTEGCYYEMFSDCTSLNYVKAMFTTTPGLSYTSSWLSNVASTGTFVKNINATWNVTGANGVPEGWNVETASE